MGLLVGIVGSIFLPHVFALISGDNFKTFSDIISNFTVPNSLSALFSAGFPDPYAGAFMVDSRIVFNPDIIAMIMNPTQYPFLYFLPAMLSWLVCGLLSGFFTQSIKKGILSAAVFVIVEILLYMLMKVIAGRDLIPEVILYGGNALTFIGGAIITPVGFSILGGLLGGLISRAVFGPEEI
ncbi:MAG: hypothetical protein Q6373_020045 [Candidatus Sigynarchaeota archaeon]